MTDFIFTPMLKTALDYLRILLSRQIGWTDILELEKARFYDMNLKAHPCPKLRLDTKLLHLCTAAGI